VVKFREEVGLVFNWKKNLSVQASSITNALNKLV